jgi:hypothetical protein
MHCLRLYFECIELMQEGQITLPRPERAFLVEIREGAFSLEEFIAEAERLRSKAEAAAVVSDLPDECSSQAISELIAEVYLEFWQRDL